LTLASKKRIPKKNFAQYGPAAIHWLTEGIESEVSTGVDSPWSLLTNANATSYQEIGSFAPHPVGIGSASPGESLRRLVLYPLYCEPTQLSPAYKHNDLLLNRPACTGPYQRGCFQSWDDLWFEAIPYVGGARVHVRPVHRPRDFPGAISFGE
jgi:hypothetical protein